MEWDNKIKVEFISKSENESLARSIAAAFAAQLDPTVEELTELKTAVSEAVSNCIIHGYQGQTDGVITMEVMADDKRRIVMIISDEGVGIPDVKRAMEPLYTTKEEEERSGMGFTVMESFTDKLEVESNPGKGTRIKMMKSLDQAYGF